MERSRSHATLSIAVWLVACGGDDRGGTAGQDDGIDDPTGSGTGIDASISGPGTKLDVGQSSATDGADEAGPDSGCRQVDFLFVIDSSISMASNQGDLVAAFPGFVDTIVNTLVDVDSYHVGVVTSDAYPYNEAGCTELGALVTQTGGPDSSNQVCGPFAEGRYMTEADDLATAFSCAALVGTGGDNDEKMMGGALGAISAALNSPGACNEGFIRDDALLVMVLITDEDDPGSCGIPGIGCIGSPGDPPAWNTEVLDRKVHPENAVVLSLTRGAPGNACGAPGLAEIDAVRIMAFASLFQATGFRGDICAPFAPFFEEAVGVIESACEGFVPGIASLMTVRIVDGHAIRDLLRMDACIELVDAALSTLARGQAVQPLRQAIRQPDGVGLLGVMPAYLGGDADSPGIKVVTVFPGNHGTELDAHQGVVLLFEGRRGRLLAIIDASEVTAIRTAAASAVATRALARADARELLVIGTGIQARTHVEAISLVRPLERLHVWGRDVERARGFAEREGARLALPIEAVADLPAAVATADIVCVATSAKQPVLFGDWLREGTHVNAVGACTPDARELDTRAVVRARLFCDRRESLLAEAGDFLIPKREGAVDDAHIVGEIGDVLIGTIAGRRSDAEITVFESLGLGVEDVAVARHIHERACERGVGLDVELGGMR